MPEQKNFAEMTDEELMNIDDSEFTLDGTEEPSKDSDTNDEPEEVDDAQEEEAEPNSNSNEKAEDSSENTANDEVEEPDEPEVEETQDTQVVESPNSDSTDALSEALAPLKANGKELKLNSIEELRNLASMGSNYSLKMQKLKPHLKMLKTLDKHDLLNEDKINHLIALTKGDKGAISKLLSDSDIDPNYMELPEPTDYQADDYSIPDSELALDEVLEEIKDSEHYSTTMHILGNVWDDASRTNVANNPQAVKTIHEHVENGMYSKIWDEVERQRMLGNLNSMTDVEAYDTVGQAMQEQGAFNPTKDDSGSDAKRKARRKSAGSTKNLGKSRKKTKTITEFDIFNMSDEEIEALTMPGLT